LGGTLRAHFLWQRARGTWFVSTTLSFLANASYSYGETSITDDLATKATLLCELLRARLHSNNYTERLKTGKQNHWCLKWASENMSTVAAYMVIFRHTKTDISCVQESRSLLSKPGSNKYFSASNAEGKLSGCYLAYNENNEELVRAGSAAGEGGCVGRWGQHIKMAKSDRNEPYSRFYAEYPDRTSIRSKRGDGKEGLFEHLTQYIAAGFDGDVVAESKVFTKDRADGGIFFYSEEQREVILRCHFSGKPDMQKFSGMVAYLLELAYDLALSPSNNVSDSPGFEACGLNL